MKSSNKVKFPGKRRLNRGAYGQALAEGAAMLPVLTGTAVILLLLVTDIGMTLSYQQKITYLASQAASFLAGCLNGWQYQNTGALGQPVLNETATQFVRDLASNMGLPASSITATVVEVASPAPAAGGNGSPPVVQVTVSGSNMPLIAGLSFLPGNISVQQTLCANTGLLPRPTGLLSIEVSSQSSCSGYAGNTVMVPCYSGLAYNDMVKTRSEGDSQDPIIPKTPGGMYDQFSFSVPQSAGAAMNYLAGNRGMDP